MIQATRNIAYNEDDPIAYINRARVYEELDAWEDAVRDLAEALRLSPGNEDALGRLERIRQMARSNRKAQP